MPADQRRAQLLEAALTTAAESLDPRAVRNTIKARPVGGARVNFVRAGGHARVLI
ncbi:hypothetical protein [Rhodococcus opacus]|uniref:hypothetical protein n=1 Tax=Rhodococcus opacus TaxID=37919 RepID=UPI00155A09BD|nr:hypothetical protein [Rhodococcus opacus]